MRISAARVDVDAPVPDGPRLTITMSLTYANEGEALEAYEALQSVRDRRLRGEAISASLQFVLTT